MKRLKPKLTLNEIGQFRFYIGILLGFAYGILTSLWFTQIDKAFLVLYDLVNQQSILKVDLELGYYNAMLTGILSASLGFCLTVYFWTSRAFFTDRKRNLKMRTANINGIFIYMLIMFVFTKFLTFDTSIRYDGFGIDLSKRFGYLPFLLPLFIFLFNWLFLGRAYRSGRFMLFSGLAVLMFGIVMGLTIV